LLFASMIVAVLAGAVALTGAWASAVAAGVVVAGAADAGVVEVEGAVDSAANAAEVSNSK
jgi:hypothetical protein